MAARISVLVTAIGGAGHGEQILKALRLADGDRYRIIGADARRDCAQFALVDEAATLPPARDPGYIDALLALCQRFQVRAVFHGCEPELRKMSAERRAIEALGIFLPVNPPAVIDLCMDKQATMRRLTALGIEVPKFIGAASRAELSAVDWFPVVVKPAVGGGGSNNVFIAQDQAELRSLADYLELSLGTSTFVVQEYVGTPDDEYTVGVLHDMDGNYLNAIAVRRLLSTQLNVRTSVPNRTGRRDLGATLVISSGVSHGYVGRFPDVTERCRWIAAEIGATGAINIQCRLAAGALKVFEINPRFSGTTSIRAMAGFNEPDVLLRRHVFGETVPVDFPYREGLVLRQLTETWVGDTVMPAAASAAAAGS